MPKHKIDDEERGDQEEDYHWLEWVEDEDDHARSNPTIGRVWSSGPVGGRRLSLRVINTIPDLVDRKLAALRWIVQRGCIMCDLGGEVYSCWHCGMLSHADCAVLCGGYGERLCVYCFEGNEL